MSTEKSNITSTTKRNDAHDPKGGGIRPDRKENYEKRSPQQEGTINNSKKGK